MRKTRIVCTLGPSTDDPAVLREMLEAGMSVARFNFSHGTHDSHAAMFRKLSHVVNEMDLHVATLLDTRGPEIRLGLFRDGKAFLKQDSRFILTARELEGDSGIASVSYPGLPSDLGDCKRILLDDGLIELEVLEVQGTEIVCRVVSEGEISDRKGVNVPGARLSFPYLSEADREDILFGIRTGFDYVAASFARTREDILAVRELLDSNGGGHVRVIAKIENAEGVANIREIIKVCDAVMIARGDMGVEIDFEDIPVLQKRIIKAAILAGKQVITATQMLESMVTHPRPTRAEITDVANAIYDGTSAIMLSGETASGRYPVESVRTMARIAERAEMDIDYAGRFFSRGISDASHDITDAISHATCLIAYNLGATAIVTVTKSGSTAKMISRFRPDIPIIACTPDAATLRQLSLSWGVTALPVAEEQVTDVLFDKVTSAALRSGLVKPGEIIVMTAGVPLALPGTTNLIRVVRAGVP